jgi:hypothetical protein
VVVKIKAITILQINLSPSTSNTQNRERNEKKEVVCMEEIDREPKQNRKTNLVSK